MGYILVSDMGTTSIKTSLFDNKLTMLGSVSGEYSLISRPNGEVELNPEIYWAKFCQGVTQICKKCAIPPAEIERIGITTQGETLIPVDARGRALRNAIVWLDTRAAREAAELSAAVDQDTFYRNTGNADFSPVWPICKLLWLRKHEPDLYAQAAYFLLLEDYMIMRLTGRFVSEKSLYSSTGYYDILHDRLWTELLERLGLDPLKIPQVVDCGTIVGTVTSGVCARTGLSPHTIVVTTAMDQVSSAMGSGNTKPGVVTDTTGTALATAATGDKRVLLSNQRITAYRHALKGKYLICPVCMTGGMALKWFKDELCAGERMEAAQTGASVYRLLDHLAAQSPRLSNGILTIPYFNGTQQPHYNPQARGVFFGVGLEHTRGDMTRSILEAIAFMLLENIEMIQTQCQIRPSQLRLCGGGSNSEVWNQIKADVVGLPACSLRISETTSLGAAALTLLPEYGEERIRELLEEANPVKEAFVPDRQAHADYKNGYVRFQKLYAALADLF